MKRKTGKKLLGILLTLAMAVGLLPGMSLTALADGTSATYNAEVNATDLQKGDILQQGAAIINDIEGQIHVVFAISSAWIGKGGCFDIGKNGEIVVSDSHGTTSISPANLEENPEYNAWIIEDISIEENSGQIDLNPAIVTTPGGKVAVIKERDDLTQGEELKDGPFTIKDSDSSNGFDFRLRANRWMDEKGTLQSTAFDERVSSLRITADGAIRYGSKTLYPADEQGKKGTGWTVVSVKNNLVQLAGISTATVPVSKVQIAPTTAALTVGGDAVALTAIVSPEDATDKKVKWSVGGEDAGAVALYSDQACTTPVRTDATEILTVYAKCVSAGSATVTATSNADSSKSASCTVTVSAAAHSVTITPGSNMSKTAASGAASQTGLSGAMTDVVYTANDGYYFPTDYSVAAVNGITVTRNSYTQITVSGTPTADVALTLTAPTEKTKPNAPTTATATDCTTADNNDGKLTGITTAMEYKKSDATVWTAGTGSDITGLVPGTYYVRIKGTDTTLASDNQELTVKGFVSYTMTFKVVNGSWDDETTADKTVTLTGLEGDTLKLTADQIPAVGAKPADTYKAGAWDVVPSTETAITAATTYTYTYAQKDSISQTVTFKVVNGSWDDETTADKTVTLTGHEGDALKLAADQIPAVGTKPADTYKAGAWDVVPSTETAITAATTYTYTYEAKSAAVVTAVPTAKALTYDGTAQELITAGAATGGTMKYAVTTENAPPKDDSLYTETIPTRIDAGTYYVWYKTVGDSTHTDSKPACVTVTIGEKIVYTAVKTSQTVDEHTIGSGEDAVLVFQRSVDDAKTIERFTSAEVDGKTLYAGDYSIKSGSLILTLKASYLDTLTPGTHQVTATFDDGSADTTITILEAPPTAAPTNVPKTGDGADLGLWLTLMLAGLLLLGGWAVYTIRKRS